MDSNLELDGTGFSPEEYVDVYRCIETLLSIRAGSQPLDRNLGIDYNCIVGYPTEVAKNMLTLEIMEKVRIYEPRVEVASISFTGNTDGLLVPHIRFIKAEV